MATNFVQKVIASANAATGLVAAANGAVQRVTGDSLGRLWARVFGDTPHDSPDNTNPQANYPVKIGGRAAASNAGFAAVATDDRTDAAFDVNGRLIVNVGAGSFTPTGVQQVEGNIANDAVDSGNPVKTGGVAVASNTAGQTPAVAAGDRVNQAMDLNGRGLVVSSGDVAHDSPDAGFPQKVGGFAVTVPTTGATAVTAGDRVNFIADLNGRQVVVAGGDVANDSVDAGNPMKMGGIAVATPSTGLAAAVAALDRVQAAFDTRGRQIVMAGGDVASAAADAGNPVKVGAVAAGNGLPGSTVTAGNRTNLITNLNGMLHVVTAENPFTDATTVVWSVTTAVAGNASGQLAIKGSAGRLRRVIAINNDPTNTLYFQIHNVAAVGSIATGTLRWPAITIPPGGVAEYDFGPAPLAMTAGICVALSTTQTTYTAAAVTGQFGAQFA